MKSFDLETYKANPSRELVTREGNKARIICTDMKGCYPIVALVNKSGCEYLITYSKQGESGFYASLDDLFFTTIKREGWVNLYHDLSGVVTGQKALYVDEESARKCIQEDKNYITTVKITWEE